MKSTQKTRDSLKDTFATLSKRQPDSNVFLIRTNSISEVLASSSLIAELHQLFPHGHLTTLLAEQSEAEEIVTQDTLIDEVIAVKPSHKKNPLTLRKLLRGRNFTYSIAVFSMETPERQPQLLFTLLFSPGRKRIYCHETLISLYSVQGLKTLVIATWSLLKNKLPKHLHFLLKKRIIHSDIDISKQPIKSILWIRPDYLGDVVLSLPTLKVLKQYFPDAQIDAVVLSSSSPIIESAEELSKIWKINFPAFSNAPIPKRQLKSTLKQMRDRHYDLALDLLGADCAREIAYKLKVPYRVGFSRFANCDFSADYTYMLTHPIEFPDSVKHDSQKRLDLLRSVGLNCGEVKPQLNPTQESKLAVERILDEMGISKPFVAIHTCTSSDVKNWTVEGFAKVADHLIQKYNFDILFTGALADCIYIENIQQRLLNKEKSFNGAGRFHVTSLPALLNAATLMVTVDTGPMHIAAAVDTPIVALVLPYYRNCFPFGQIESTLVPNIQRSNDGEEMRSALKNSLSIITPQEVCEAIDHKLNNVFKGRLENESNT